MRAKLTYANVLSTLCLFLLLGGGAYAATQLPKNSVGPKQLKKNSVTSAKVKNGSLTSSDLRSGTIPAVPDSYTKAESNGRFLGRTITVIKTIDPALKAGEFAGDFVDCPSGYQVIGGGVEPDNILQGKVSVSAPYYGGGNVAEGFAVNQPDGLHGPAVGWYGGITTQGSTGDADTVKIVAVCAALG